MIVIPKHKKGDWWDGMTLTFRDDNNVVINLTGYSFKAEFKTSALRPAVFDFSTANNTITIPNPTDGKIVFVSRIIDEGAFNYVSDLQMTPPNGHIKTVSVINWEISQDITT